MAFLIGRKLLNVALGISVGAFSLGSSVHAQNVSVPEVQRQVDDAFKEVLTKAASTESRMRYANLLVQTGNFEGGIAALEGLLLSPDASPSIRLDLAVLYFRLGSYAMSEYYLREALADNRLDINLRRQAESLLVEVERRNQASSLSGHLMVGMRAQSNPTAATSNSQILSFGNLVPRDPNGKPKSDIDLQISGRLDHAYDLRAQNEATIISSLVGFADHFTYANGGYSSGPSYLRPYDLSMIAGTTGVRFKPLPSDYQNLTIMPQLILGDTLFKGRQYFSVGGAGLQINNRISEKLALGGSYEVRDFSFAARSDIADAKLQDGLEHAIRIRGLVETGLNRFVVAEFGYTDHGAKANYYEFHGPDLRLSYVAGYASPFGGGSNWTTTVSGSATQRYYRAPDQSITLASTRHDTEWKASLINAMPLTRDTLLQVQLEYTKNSSNILNYEYSNFSGMLGLMWKF